jgi:hypothetical protein
MLASLEIISPNTFEVSVPWQQHLSTARQILLDRGGPSAITRKDKISFFLFRWFSYLDVLGTLSGSKTDQPLFTGPWEGASPDDAEDDFQIDCLLGFTSHCVAILAKIANLARDCDSKRIRPATGPDEYPVVDPQWEPSADVAATAATLQAELESARNHVYRGCVHAPRGGLEASFAWDSIEMTATNGAFHSAGLIQLHRRVLNKSSAHPDVQEAVREVVGSLSKVRRGGTAEACLTFPMFTAGCDAQDQKQRNILLERLTGVEMTGMTQVGKARRLMEAVWRTGREWGTLRKKDLFFG